MRQGPQAEGWRPHTPSERGSCLFRIRLAATPKRRQQLLADRGRPPKSPLTRPAGRSAPLCRAIPNTRGDGEAVERSEVSCLAPCFHVELCADAPNEFHRVIFGGKHPAQKKQVARLHRFHVGAERLRRRRELDAKSTQPLLGAGRPRAFAAHHVRLRIIIHWVHVPPLLNFRKQLVRFYPSCTSAASTGSGVAQSIVLSLFFVNALQFNHKGLYPASTSTQ